MRRNGTASSETPFFQETASRSCKTLRVNGPEDEHFFHRPRPIIGTRDLHSVWMCNAQIRVPRPAWRSRCEGRSQRLTAKWCRAALGTYLRLLTLRPACKSRLVGDHFRQHVPPLWQLGVDGEGCFCGWKGQLQRVHFVHVHLGGDFPRKF